MGVKTPCPYCGKEYKLLAQHWRFSPDHRPEFTQEQKEVITGLIMGDGCINTGDNQNPRIKCVMTSPKYLKHLDNIFGCLGTGVSLKTTAKENANKSRDSGFSPDAEVKNYSDLYVWRSRRNPNLQKWADWYSTGKKVWPEDIELTPTVLKHWYCGDGCWDNQEYNNRIQISMANEIENQDKVNQMFENVGLPSPHNYNISERKDESKRCGAIWTVEQSHKLWEYMGEPLPDFEYKWPSEYR